MSGIDNAIMTTNGAMTLRDLLIQMIGSGMDVNDALKITLKHSGLYVRVEVKITEAGEIK